MTPTEEVTPRDGLRTQALNAVCPYYTMFPLSFPVAQLVAAKLGDVVLDPFCGRGTTLFAARLAGLTAVGIDSNPVAVAISQAKLSDSQPQAIERLAREILKDVQPDHTPLGEFWDRAYAPRTFEQILQLRAGLKGRTGPTSNALRAIVLGALHGPRTKLKPSYLSNQMPRTFASKPAYSVKFWTERQLIAPEVDVLRVICERAQRYYGTEIKPSGGTVMLADARTMTLARTTFSVVITSPPYFGMRSYVPDQWLRDWFLGGQAFPTYIQPGQLASKGTANEPAFAAQLGKVWRNVATACIPGARLSVRLGALRSRPSNPLAIMKESLNAADAGWQLIEVRPAGDAHRGKRQADQMGQRGRGTGAVDEYDFDCKLIT